jgi:hypothetical protein
VSPVDLTRERWLRLVGAARVAAALPHLDCPDLERLANALRETPSPLEGAGRCAVNAFRWSCLWFVAADPVTRAQLARPLTDIADQVARMLLPRDPDPEAAAAALPPAGPETEAPAPDWRQRPNCGVG